MTTLSSTERRKLRNRFLHRSGYGPNDILSLNYSTGVFLTRGGGKYRLKGNRVIHLAGPASNPSKRL